MGNESLKNFLKSIRRFQKKFKFSLFFLLVLVVLCAVGVIYYRHRALQSQPLPVVSSDISLNNQALNRQTAVTPPQPTPTQKPKAFTSKTKFAGAKFTAVHKSIGKRPGYRSARPTYKTIYVVKKGDSLWKISSHYYHSGSHWTGIYWANHRAIGHNANLIHPHLRLVISQTHPRR